MKANILFLGLFLVFRDFRMAQGTFFPYEYKEFQ